MRFLLLLLVVFVFYSCAETEEKTNVCRNVNCGHGSCVDDNGTPRCDCDDGYQPEGLTCIADDPCVNVICDDWKECNNGLCLLKDNRCDQIDDCEGDKECNSEHYCIDQSDPCNDVTCSGNGNCVAQNGSPSCNCYPGYHNEGLECIEDYNPCQGVTCSNHGDCVVENNSPNCDCDNGYIANGLQCILESVDFCEGVTCSNHGNCEVVNNAPSCNCDEGYTVVGLECKEDSNPCEGIICSGNGTCIVSNDVAACNCDEGYQAEGLECVSIEDPCRGVACSGHGVCVLQGGSPTCNCEDGYNSVDLTCIEEQNYEIEWCNLQSPQTININIEELSTSTIPIYGQVLAWGITSEETTEYSDMKAQLGISTTPITVNTDFSTLTWIDADFNQQYYNNHEYMTNFQVENAGIYYYIYRFSIDNGNLWSYCGIYGIMQDSITSGVANISEQGDPCDGVTCSNHGVCEVNNGEAACICESGYTVEGIECIENETPEVEWCSVWSPQSIVGGVGTERVIYGQVFIPNITTEEIENDQVRAQLGITTTEITSSSFNPEWFNWIDATFNIQFGNNHEYMANFTFENSGTHYYIYRFSVDGGTTWKFCDINGVVTAESIATGIAHIFAPCDQVTCSDHGVCRVENGTAVCDCNDGYVPSEGGLECLADTSGITWCNLQHPLTINGSVGDSNVAVFGQVLIWGITTQETPQPQVLAQLGYQEGDISLPIDENSITWVDGEFNAVEGNNHEYMANFPLSTAGTYSYIYRFSHDAGDSWTYCDSMGIVIDSISSGTANITEVGDPCDGVSCSNHGICSVENGEAVCSCDVGYHNGTDPLICEEDETPSVEWCKLHYPSSINGYLNESKFVYGHVFIPNITTENTANDQVIGQLGYSESDITYNSLSSEAITWIDGEFNETIGNNHEYMVNWNFDSAALYNYIFRFSADGGSTWSYCDLNNMITETTEIAAGVANISAHEVDWCRVWEPTTYSTDINIPQQIKGQVFIPGITDQNELESDLVKAQIGYSSTPPSSISELSELTWVETTFNQQYYNNHEYKHSLVIENGGTYHYFYRFSADGGTTWTYCDTVGDLSESSEIIGGVATITAPNPCMGITCSDHGTCVAESGEPSCVCDNGYIAGENLTCVEEQNNPEVQWCKLQGPSTINATVGDPDETIYAQVFIPDVTTVSAESDIITGQLGYSTDNSSSLDSFNWVLGSFNSECSNCGNNHEYMSSFPISTSGTFYYIYRFSTDSGVTWTYCDLQGVASDTPDFGVATIEAGVNPCDGVTCSDHGSCTVENEQAVCNCDDGYYADGLTCIEDSDPCDGVTCSNHGSCIVENDEAICNCDDGYHNGTDPLTCEEDQNEELTYHTITVDGDSSDWYLTTENLGDGGVSIETYLTWDSSNIYLNIENKDFSSDSSASYEIYFDVWDGLGDNSGQNYAYDHDGGVNARALPSEFMADYFISVTSQGAQLYDINSTTQWWDISTSSFSGNILSNSTTTELSIPLSMIGAGVDVRVYIILTNSDNDYVYATWPIDNIKGEDNIAGTDGDQYYHFPLSSNETPNSNTFIVTPQ